MTAGQNNRCMIGNINPVLPEVFRRNSFDVDEGSEIDFQAVLLREIIIGRLL